MSSFLSKTRSLDLYAFSPSLTFGKEGKVYSRLGFLLTLITILIIGSMTIFLSIQVFQRQKPSLIQYQLPSQSRIPFNTDTLPFALTTTDWLRNPEAFEVSAKLLSSDYNIDLSVDACEKNDQNYYCFSQPQGTKSQTYLEKGGRSYLQINFNQCDSEDSGTPQNCFSSDDLKTFLNNNDYHLVYDDLVIDPTDYDKPIKSTKTLFSDPFTADTRKTLLITLEEVEFITDNGLIFEDFKTETHLRASLSTQLIATSASDSTVFTAKIQYNGNKTVYKRTYPKIQDLLAQIAGFITIIIPIFFIFVFPYVNMKASQDFVNEICEVQLNRKQENLNKRIAKSRTKASSKPSKYRAQTTTHGNLTTLNLETKADVLASHRGKRSQFKTLKTMKTEPDLQPKTTIVELNQSLQIRETKYFEAMKDHLESFEILEENILTPRPPESILKVPSCPFKASPLFSPKSVESRGGEEEDNEETNDGMMTSKRLLGGGVAEKLRTMMKEKEEGRQEIVIKIGSEEPEDKNEKENEQEESSEVENIIVPLRVSDKIQVSWSDWFFSFFKPEPKVQIIKEAKNQILKTLDLVNLAKKVIEIDKLKACLLTHDQRVIFENLPSSVIAYDSGIKTEDSIRQYHWKETFKGDQKALKEAYIRITGAKTPRRLDKRLIKLYESENLEDHVDAMVRTRKN